MKTVIRRFPSNTPVEDIYKGRIWGSYGGWYEDGCLLGCSAV
jgi:hypothetical protein